MARINETGYLERRGGRKGDGKRAWRSWWLVKRAAEGKHGWITIEKKTICVPKKFVGKRIMLKAEEIE